MYKNKETALKLADQLGEKKIDFCQIEKTFEKITREQISRAQNEIDEVYSQASKDMLSNPRTIEKEDNEIESAYANSN